MAAERDLELLDDYLSNRLRGQEKTAFEQKLKSDLDLKGEYQLQHKLIEGIKNVRVAELKSMLNNTSVPSLGAEKALFAKLAVGVVIAGLVGTGIYLFNQQQEPVITKGDTITYQSDKDGQPQEAAKEEIAPSEQKATERHEKRDQNKERRRASKNTTIVTEEEKVAEKQKLEVFDPTRENDASVSQNNSTKASEDAKETTSSIAVETDNTNKKYTFHYQFKNDKLILFGSFEKNLYEILEFFSENKRTAFLYYKESYYLLNDDNEKIKPLTPISDPVLIKKLKEYRGN